MFDKIPFLVRVIADLSLLIQVKSLLDRSSYLQMQRHVCSASKIRVRDRDYQCRHRRHIYYSSSSTIISSPCDRCSLLQAKYGKKK